MEGQTGEPSENLCPCRSLHTWAYIKSRSTWRVRNYTTCTLTLYVYKHRKVISFECMIH